MHSSSKLYSKVIIEGYTVGYTKWKVKILASELEDRTSAHSNASGIWVSSSQNPGVPPLKLSTPSLLSVEESPCTEVLTSSPDSRHLSTSSNQ